MYVYMLYYMVNGTIVQYNSKNNNFRIKIYFKRPVCYQIEIEEYDV